MLSVCEVGLPSVAKYLPESMIQLLFIKLGSFKTADY